MSLNLCRNLVSAASVRSTFGGSLLKSYAPAASRLLQIETNQIGRAGFANERIKLGLRKQNLPEYPHIECVKTLDVKTFLPSNYKQVQYGDYKFIESTDGYVQVYVQGYCHPKNLDARAAYAIYFGDNHPLNISGAVERRQRLNHAKLYGFLKAMHQVPKDLFKNVCICVDEIPLITFIDRSLRNMSENSFRSVHTGRLNKDLETSMEINKALRLRQDLVLRLKYVPNDIGVDGMYKVSKMSIKASDEVNQQYLRQKIQNNDKLD